VAAGPGTEARGPEMFRPHSVSISVRAGGGNGAYVTSLSRSSPAATTISPTK
jgi:hypothetical protein